MPTYKINKETIETINQDAINVRNTLRIHLDQGKKLQDIIDGRIRDAKATYAQSSYDQVYDNEKDPSPSYIYQAKIADLYRITKAKVDAHGTWDWLFHPVRTYRENKAYKLVKEHIDEMRDINGIDINDKKIEMYGSIQDKKISALPEELEVDALTGNYQEIAKVNRQIVEENELGIDDDGDAVLNNDFIDKVTEQNKEKELQNQEDREKNNVVISNDGERHPY